MQEQNLTNRERDKMPQSINLLETGQRARLRVMVVCALAVSLLEVKRSGFPGNKFTAA